MQHGYLGLREQLAEWITRRDGRAVEPDGRDARERLHRRARARGQAHLGPGDGAIVEAPTYPHTRRFMRHRAEQW